MGAPRGKKSGRLAFLFPGQGRIPQGPPVPSEVGERLLALAEEAGLPLREWLAERRTDLLEETRVAQPAILIDSLAKEEALRRSGIDPFLVAGHSLGEYSAAVSAGLLAAEEAFAFVLERGRRMAEVSGGMAAIVKLPLDVVRTICAEVVPPLAIANVNGPEQVVISGEREALAQAAARVEKAGGRAIPLRVSGPFHSPLMARAQAALAPRIAKLSLRPPGVPLVSSASGRVETDPEEWRRLLLTQITACVRWVDVVETLAREGVTRAIEVGPGDVLAGLSRRIAPKIEFLSLEEALDGGV